VTLPQSSLVAQPTSGRNIILLPIGESQYDVQTRFLTDLAAAMADLGYEAPLLNPHNPQHFDQMIAWTQAGRVVGSFHCNGVWLRPIEMFDGKDLFDEHGIASVSWYGDPPLTYLTERLQLQRPHDTVLMADEQWVPLVQQYGPNPVRNCQFVQVGGRQLIDTPSAIEQRSHGLVFFGSYVESSQYWTALEQALANASLPQEPLFATVEEQLDLYLHNASWHETHDFSLSFLQALEARGLDPRLPRYRKAVRQFLQILDRYLRAVRRESVVRAIQRLPLAIYGNGWDRFETSQTNLTIRPAVSLDENIAIVANSRMALSQNILTAGSAHCRIPYIMANHTPLVTENCQWIANRLDPYSTQNPKGAGCVAYSFAPGVDIEGWIEPVYRDTARLEAMAERGQALFKQHLSWHGFAQSLIETILVVAPQEGALPV
jgi:hypothetical protein